MAIKVFGDKIVFPDNTEQSTAADSADTSYTKAEIDAQQGAQDVKIDKNTADLNNVYTKTEVDSSQSAQDTEIAKKVSEAPLDGETYARNNETWVSISDTSGIPDAPVDGLMYGRQDGEWGIVADASDIYTKTETNTLLDEKADKSTTYTKAEVDTSQGLQDTAIQANTDAIAALPAPIDTYTKTEIDAQQALQDTAIDDNTGNISTNTGNISTNAGNIATNTSNISTNTSNISTNTGNIASNTTAIGALSGRVSANEQDIATLQEGIFFSSSYATDYPSSPNRDPETGNIYLQNLSAFTYSYADANQVFISKTDEQGNVRQFTAVKPDDILVLNQVESPNYGRYKVLTVNDLGNYVNVIIEFQVGEGTVLEGDTLALQAFPASEGGIWTEVGDVASYDGDIAVKGGTIDIRDYKSGADFSTITTSAENGINFDVYGSTRMSIKSGGVSTTQDMTVNGKKVVTEAPEDGKEYARKDGDWSEVGGGPSLDIAIGMVAPFAMNSVPEGWLHCDGSAVSRDTYSLLYSKVGDTYGVGDGSTTFNLPDLQDEFVRGSSDTLPVGTKQNDAFKSHNHSSKGYSLAPVAGGQHGAYTAYGNLTASYISTEGGTETRPRNVAMLYCINATAEATTRASSSDSIWTEIAGVATYGGDVSVGDTPSNYNDLTLKNGDGYLYLRQFDTVFPPDGGSGEHSLRSEIVAGNNLNFNVNGNNAMTIDTNSKVTVNNAIEYKAIADYVPIDSNTRIYGKSGVGATYDSYTHTFRTGGSGSTVGMYIDTIGNVKIKGGLNIETAGSSTGVANCVLGSDGNVYRTTNVAYSTEEVDERLAIKDKLIEKLSARLDELEKKVN